MKAGVVGAGIMGRLLAYALIKDGHQVSVFDGSEQVNAINCSPAAAGLLLPVTELEKSPLLIYQLGREALKDHWPAILADLSPVYFQRTGSLVVSHPKDKSNLIRFIDVIKTKIQLETGIQHYQKLNQKELLALEPSLYKFEQAYYFPNEAHLDTETVLAALKHYLCKQNVAWYHVWVDEILPGKIRVQKEVHTFDMIFDCRGMNAKSVFSNLQGIRGELIWLHAPGMKIKHPIRFQHPRYSLYISPRLNDTYLVGASEIHSENYGAISVRTTLELLTAIYYLHPGFAEARIQKTVTQCRPTFPDYLPKIKYRDKIIAINGLYRHGFLIAPALSAEIMRWLKHDKSSLYYSQIGEFS